MYKILIMLSGFFASPVFGQEAQLFTLEMIKPRAGQMTEFEAAWRSHVAKFHATDKKKRYVHSILSGPYLGYYQLMEGPSTFAGMDGINPEKHEHDLDYDRNVLPRIDVRKGNLVYSHLDSLSYHTAVHPEKIITTVFHLKNGAEAEFLSEMKRTVAIDRKINSKTSYNCYVLNFSGSSPQVLLVTNLPGGFAELGAGYLPATSAGFKEAYIKEYTTALWERRTTVLNNLVNRYETYIAKLNKSLSSPIE